MNSCTIQNPNAIMKYSFAIATVVALQVQNTIAFAPSSVVKVPSTQRSAFVDPSIFADVHHHVDSLSSMLSSMTLADGTDLADGAVVVDAAGAAAEIVKNDNGWFGFLEGPIESLLQGIHTGLVGAGMKANTWGLTILAMTTLIKLATYPLTRQQLGSTQKMQVRL